MGVAPGENVALSWTMPGSCINKVGASISSPREEAARISAGMETLSASAMAARQRRCAAETSRGIFGQAAHNHPRQGGRNVWVNKLRSSGHGGKMLDGDSGYGVTSKWLHTCTDLVEDDAK